MVAHEVDVKPPLRAGRLLGLVGKPPMGRRRRRLLTFALFPSRRKCHMGSLQSGCFFWRSLRALVNIRFEMQPPASLYIIRGRRRRPTRSCLRDRRCLLSMRQQKAA